VSRITLQDIQKGDAVTITAPNADLNSWQTASTDIDDLNVGEEGLDRRSLTARVVTPTSGTNRFVYDGAQTLIAGSITAPVTLGGSFAVAGPFTFDQAAGDMLTFRCSLQYEGIKVEAAGGAASNTQITWDFYLRYSTDWDGATGTWATLDKTRRRVAYQTTGVVMHGSVAITHKVTAVLDTTTLYVGLFVYQSSALDGAPYTGGSGTQPTTTISYAHLYGKLRAK